MDRHNMMLFLLQDTLRKDPVGFENRRRNIFDPEEDAAPRNNSLSSDSPKSTRDNKIEGKNASEESESKSKRKTEDSEKKENLICSRHGCTRKPRFDSLFCSDSCGLSALESDLLRTFQYSSDIHPSMLRN